MQRESVSSPGVLIRDVLIFQLKLVLDGLKDVVLFQASIIAALLDLVLLRREPATRFYAVLRLSERFDLWLNLNGAAQAAARSEDGLFGASLAGSDTLLGKLEQLVRSKVEAAAHTAASGAGATRS
ncbi:MAG TPA: hypothetical protein VF192_11425 [Longimicrobiales bacterium]